MNIVIYPNHLGIEGNTQQQWVANPHNTLEVAEDFINWHNKLYDVMDSIDIFNIYDLNKIRFNQVKFNHIYIYDPNFIPHILIEQQINKKKIKQRGKWFEAALKIAQFIENASWRGDNKLGQHIAEWRLNKDGIDLFM